MTITLKTKSIIEKLRKETELRVEIFNEGMNFTKEAYEGVGTKWNEDVTGMFGYYFEGWKPGIEFPSCFRQPLGTTSKIVYNVNSPYVARKDGDTIVLEKNGKFISTIEFVPRPKLYALKHSDGVAMKQTGNWLCYSGWSTCVYSDCMYWATGDQCAFCNSNAQFVGGKGKYEGTWVHKTPEQMGEAAAVAVACGANSLLLSCGTRAENFLVDLWEKMLKKMREYTGIKLPFVNLNPPALKNLENIDRLFEAGARAMVIDQEVWDANSFKAMCPGKAKTIGREAWMKAIEYVAEKYTKPEKGKVAVACALVLGLEEKSKYVEATKYYADRNIPVHLPPWKVLKGSNLYGHKSPYTWWTMEVMEECMEIQLKKMPWLLTLDAWKQTFQHGYNGAQTVIWWDWIRRAMIEKGLITLEDKQLQDWQLAGINWDHIQNVLTEKKIITEKDGHVKDWPKLCTM